MLVKQTKTQVKADVKKNGTWHGYIVGSNVAEYHIRHGWHLGFEVNLAWDADRNVAVQPDVDEYDSATHTHIKRDLDGLIENWGWYNANSETGMYPHYYKIVNE